MVHDVFYNSRGLRAGWRLAIFFFMVFGSAELAQFQPAALQIQPVEIGDLQFAARRRLEAARQFHHRGVIEIKPRHRDVGFRPGGFFLKAGDLAAGIETDDAEALGIGDLVAEQDRAFLDCQGTANRESIVHGAHFSVSQDQIGLVDGLVDIIAF